MSPCFPQSTTFVSSASSRPSNCWAPQSSTRRPSTTPRTSAPSPTEKWTSLPEEICCRDDQAPKSSTSRASKSIPPGSWPNSSKSNRPIGIPDFRVRPLLELRQIQDSSQQYRPRAKWELANSESGITPSRAAADRRR